MRTFWRHAARSFASIAPLTGLACARGADRPTGDESATGRPRDAVHAELVISQLPDTAIIRTTGVPTDRDDTLGTMYQKHEAPRRVAAPACLPAGPAFCLVDTARTFVSGAVDEGDGGIPDERVADWIVFAAANDSMQAFVVPEAYLTMRPWSAAGFHAEHALGVDGSWIRARFPRAGAYLFRVAISSDTSVGYQLRVVPVVATGASRPIGAYARLTIAGDTSTRVGIVPASMSGVLDARAMDQHAVRAGSYRVLLVRDTSYVACRLPCRERRRLTLRPWQEATVRP